MATPKSGKNKLRKLGIAALSLVGLGAGGHTFFEHKATHSFNQYAAQSYTPNAECLTTIYNQASQININDTVNAHDVLVLPGFGTNDAYMRDLRHALEDAGHRVHTWEGGILGTDVEANAAQIEKRIEDIYAENGGEALSIVGYSLGGVYARETARQDPDKIRQVITLSSPFDLKEKNSTLNARIQAIHDLYDTANAIETDALLPVPVTAIASSSDLMVNWSAASLKSIDDKSENLHVPVGHIRMPFSDNVSALVIDRLSEPQDHWRPAVQKHCRIK